VVNATNRRTFHIPEFMTTVALEAVRGTKTINEIAQEYGVHPYQIVDWKKEILEQAKTLFAGKRGPAPAAVLRRRCLSNSEFSKLESELDELKNEVLNMPAAVRRSWISKTSGVSISRQCVLAGVSRATVYAEQKKRREKSLHPAKAGKA
jgi:transposase-like protein